MVGWREPDLNVERLEDILPEVRDERIPVVTDYGGWTTEPLDPFQEALGALGGAGLRHRKALKPSGAAIKHRE